jgi:hypothetical protein
VGNTIWIEVQGRPVEGTHHDMNVLNALSKPLGVLARKLGVNAPSDFLDYTELLAAYDESDDELPGPAWFDSGKGLETFRALRISLENDFGALEWKPEESQQHYPQRLLDHLRFCESILEEAVANAEKFRLLVVA